MSGSLQGISEFLFGQPEEIQRIDRYQGGQQELLNQLIAIMSGRQGPGGAGGLGFLADLFGADDSRFVAPEMRRFQQEIIPGIAEQFAGLGSGALRSSGFQQAATQAGVDLSERLAAQRGQRQLQGLGQLAGLALTPEQEVSIRPQTLGAVGGFLEGAGKGAGQGLAAYLGGL